MRLILSRKGFDSAAGGCSNPILPNGKLIPLPIPDAKSPIPYRAIQQQSPALGTLVTQLTAGKITSRHGAHLDPDLSAGDYPREEHWQPLLGQSGAAFGHLHKQGVCTGDIFLFFGVFQPVQLTKPVNKPSGARARWQFQRSLPKRHILWGWLQIGEVVKIDNLPTEELQWARYHPHFYRGPDPNNHLFIATDRLKIDGRDTGLPGSGRFHQVADDLCLTVEDGPLTQWQLPAWSYPEKGRPPLSYHHKPERWLRQQDRVLLSAVARGQEFVLDCRYYPEALPWLESLIQRHA